MRARRAGRHARAAATCPRRPRRRRTARRRCVVRRASAGHAEEQAGQRTGGAAHGHAPAIRHGAPRVGADGHADGQEQERGGHHVGQEPGAAQHGRVPGHRAEAVEERAQQRRRASRRDAQQHRPAEHDVDRAQDGGHQRRRWCPGRRPPRTAAAGWRAGEGTGSVPGRPSERQDVLEVVVLVRPLGDRVGDLGPPLEEGVSLPHEVVVEVGRAGGWSPVDHERQGEERQRSPRRGRGAASRASSRPPGPRPSSSGPGGAATAAAGPAGGPAGPVAILALTSSLFPQEAGRRR